MENFLPSADVNECLFQDACDANCVCNNTVGSYRCENCQNVNGKYSSWSIRTFFIKWILYTFAITMRTGPYGQII